MSISARIQDVLAVLKTPSQQTKDMLGAAATTLAAGYFGGTQGIEAVGKFATMKKQMGEQRRLDKIAEAKRKMEEDRATLEAEQTRQQIAESKGRMADSSARLQMEGDYKKLAGENLKDQAFNRSAKTGLEATKLMMQGMGLGGGGKYRSSGTGKAPVVKPGKELRPPIVPSSAKPAERTRAMETFAQQTARKLIDTGTVRSNKEFTYLLPTLMEFDDWKGMRPQDRIDIGKEIKMAFADAFRPDIAERTRKFRKTGEGLEAPAGEANLNNAWAIPGGAAAGGAIGSAFGPVGTYAGAALGGMVGREIGWALPRDFAHSMANALATYQPSPGSGQGTVRNATGDVVGGSDASGANLSAQTPFRRPIPRRGYGI
jgi:hypothetical protein